MGDKFLKALKKDKKVARATHNIWAMLEADGTAHKGDDGGAGAGIMILRMLERAALTDHVVVVTRWYGGEILVETGSDTFRAVSAPIWTPALDTNQGGLHGSGIALSVSGSG